MGVFTKHQPLYAAAGIATFPTSGKRPLVSNWKSIGLDVSRQLLAQFPDADALGFRAGPDSGVTIVDLDTPDEGRWRKAERRFGATPIKVRTGSGHLHLWYRHNGELRRHGIEPQLDILGDGLVIASPSRVGAGYEWLGKGLEAIGDLPVARNLPIREEAGPGDRIQVGERNSRLFGHLMRHVRGGTSFACLRDEAHQFAKSFEEPIPQAEIDRTIASVWHYEQTGQNRFGSKPTVQLPIAVLERLEYSSEAIHLYALYRGHHHGKRSEFVVANAMADNLKWTLAKFRKARSILEREGLLVCLHRGGSGRGDPPRYRFGELNEGRKEGYSSTTRGMARDRAGERKSADGIRTRGPRQLSVVTLSGTSAVPDAASPLLTAAPLPGPNRPPLGCVVEMDSRDNAPTSPPKAVLAALLHVIGGRGRSSVAERQPWRSDLVPRLHRAMCGEIIHILWKDAGWGVPYGLFTQEEWRTLVKGARAQREMMTRINRDYADLPGTGRMEEAVAEMYRDWAAAQDSSGPLARSFTKIATLLRVMASGLRGDGYSYAALVVERIASGNVGGRGRECVAPGRMTTSAAFDCAPVASLIDNELGERA